ncbi:hypothetical protein GB937_001340 [Aspergillus fischeri]|nr:hypothetical protein GB937_001340 [Aspergillus fischeri]
MSLVPTFYATTTVQLYEDFDALRGKTILILGAATGIGRSAVELALEHGANVVVADWNDCAECLLKPYPGRSLFCKCDVSNWENVLDVFETAYTKFGIIHAVISNAGINTHESLLTAEFDATTNRLQPPSLKSIEVNLIGQLYVTKCALHYFAKWPATHCQLVMTSSAGAFFPAPPIYMYCAAKSGILGLMRALRSEVGKRNVTVNVVAPWLTGAYTHTSSSIPSGICSKAGWSDYWLVTPMLLSEWLQTWGDLPKNSPSGVARALFLPVLRPTLNGKSFFVAGDLVFEFEDSLQQAEPSWMGQELCEQCANGISGNIFRVPRKYTFQLSSGFNGSLGGNFVDTTDVDPDIAAMLNAAADSPFISYDPEFESILRPSPKLELLAGPVDRDLALEGGIYVAKTNSVWFTGIGRGEAGHVVRALNLSDNTIYKPVKDYLVRRPNGGTYYRGHVYIAFWGNRTVTGGVLAINVETGEVETVVNNYFGLSFNSPNDVAWVQRTDPRSGDRRCAMFFTDNDFGAPSLLNETGPAVLPNTVWKFDPDAESLQPVITRTDIPDPNGVAVNLNATKLYVSDTPVSYIRGQGIGTSGSPAIYVYDLTEELVPVNKRLFSFSRSRIPDGIKVDAAGRVWSAEGGRCSGFGGQDSGGV